MKTLTRQSIAEAVAEYAPRYGISKAFLFGSYARDEADSESDVDLCIETEKGFSLFSLSGFGQRVENALGRPVDVVCGETSFYPRARQRYERDKVLVYARP